ncbi:MAG: zf-HC2 domain-containing protein [Candidatus Polarisedimenticolia bacterium]
MTAHPDDVITAAYLEGTLSPAERSRVEAHLADCSPCRAGVILLAGSMEENPPVPREMRERALAVPAREPATASASGRWWSMLPAGVGVIGLLMLVAGLSLRTGVAPPPPPVPVERSAPAALEALTPAAGEVLEVASIAFTWSEVPEADRYEVNVLDAQGRTIMVLESRRPWPPVTWPGERPLPPPGTYLWSVRALSLDRVVAETRPRFFVVQ